MKVTCLSTRIQKKKNTNRNNWNANHGQNSKPNDSCDEFTLESFICSFHNNLVVLRPPFRPSKWNFWDFFRREELVLNIYHYD